MKKLKKLSKILLLLTMLTGCDQKEEVSNEQSEIESIVPDGQIAYEGKVVASKMETKENGRKYLTVDGQPFLMLGSQLRTDFFLKLDKLEYPELDRYFKLASSLHLTCVQVPICWEDVETSEDVYDHTVVDVMMKYARKYDMKLEILWFGSYMCGYSVEHYVPSYVFQDTTKYPRVGSTQVNGWIGGQGFLYPNTTNLVDRVLLNMCVDIHLAEVFVLWKVF